MEKTPHTLPLDVQPWYGPYCKLHQTSRPRPFSLFKDKAQFFYSTVRGPFLETFLSLAFYLSCCCRTDIRTNRSRDLKIEFWGKKTDIPTRLLVSGKEIRFLIEMMNILLFNFVCIKTKTFLVSNSTAMFLSYYLLLVEYNEIYFDSFALSIKWYLKLYLRKCSLTNAFFFEQSIILEIIT